MTKHQPTSRKPTAPYLLDTYDLAQLLHVTRKTVSNWVASGKIRVHRVPGSQKNHFLRYEIEEDMGLPHVDDEDH